MTSDMTKGSPLKLLLMFSIPLLIGNIFQQFYSMADTIIVGRTLGVSDLAAVGSTGSISFLVIGFVTGITSGFSVITAQRFGAGDEKGLRRSIGTSIILSILIAAVITVISVLTAYPLLRIMNTPSDIIESAYRYIVVIFAGIFATVFFNLFSNILRALGDSRTPLIFLVIASIINIVLDFVFILNFSMGVAGAGWATVIAQLLSGVLCLMYSLKKFPILRLHKEDWRLSWGFIWHHLRIALPMAFQFSITAIGTMVIQSALNSLGSTAVASFTAATKIDQFAIQPLISFGVAIATYSAQNFGAGKIDRIKRGVKSCSLISAGFSIAAGVLVMLFCSTLISLFVGEGQTAVEQQAQLYLQINTLFYIVLGLLFVFRNVLQGIGSSTVPLLAGVCELVIRAAIAFMLVGKLGFLAICIASPAAWIGAAIPLAAAYFIMMKRISGLRKI